MISVKKIVNNPSIRTAGIFTSGNFLAAGISALGGIIVARLISPNILGEFAKYGILTSYLGFGLIPVHAAFQRHYLFYIGKGEKNQAIEIATFAKWWYVAFSWLATCVFIILIIISIIKKDIRAVFGWSAQIPIIWMLIFGAYLQVLYRTSGDFRKLTLIQLIISGVSTFFLIFVKLFEYWGLASRLFFKNLTGIFFYVFYAPSKIKSKYNLQKIIELSKVSIPLGLPAYIDTYMLKGTINYFILTQIGEKNLGIYSMALTIQGFIMIFNSSLSQIITTKISLKYGNTEDIFKTLKYALRPTLMVFLLAIIITLIFSITIDPLMTNFTPKYVQSIYIIKIIVWQLPLATLLYPLIVLTSALWYKTTIVLRLIKTFSCLAYVFILSDDLTGVAWSLIFADVVILLGSYGVLFYTKLNKSYKKNDQVISN